MKRWMAAALCILLAFSLDRAVPCWIRLTVGSARYCGSSSRPFPLRHSRRTSRSPRRSPAGWSWNHTIWWNRDLIRSSRPQRSGCAQGLQDAENLSWNIHSLHLTLGTDGMPLTLTADLYAYRDGPVPAGAAGWNGDAAAGRLHQEVNNVGTLMESDAESGADNTENPNLRPDLVAERAARLAMRRSANSAGHAAGGGIFRLFPPGGRPDRGGYGKRPRRL